VSGGCAWITEYARYGVGAGTCRVMQHSLAGIQTADGRSLCGHSAIEILGYCLGPRAGEWANSSMVTESRCPYTYQDGYYFPLDNHCKKTCRKQNDGKKRIPCVYRSTEFIPSCQTCFEFFCVCCNQDDTSKCTATVWFWQVSSIVTEFPKSPVLRQPSKFDGR